MRAVGWRFGFQRAGKRLAVLTALTRPGSTGTPPLVRIRTDTFLRREKCPRCRVRGCVSPGGRERNDNAACGGDGPGEALYSKLPFPLPGRRCGAGSFARDGRVTVRRRTRRFGHAALAPCSVFAPRRTTRRQCRVWLGLHRAAGRAKLDSSPPRFSSTFPTPPERCRFRSTCLARSASGDRSGKSSRH